MRPIYLLVVAAAYAWDFPWSTEEGWAPAEDAPTATVLLDRLTRTGQEPMASVVLDFAGGRRNGPRRREKLRAKKDKRGKAPRKQLAKRYLMRQRVIEGRL